MTLDEFKHWQEVTASSTHQWVEDEVVRLNGRGARYYTGGEDGIYLELSSQGMLTLARYEGAFPHIGEAEFTVESKWDCGNFNSAFAMACRLGGKPFLADMFSNQRIPHGMVGSKLSGIFGSVENHPVQYEEHDFFQEGELNLG